MADLPVNPRRAAVALLGFRIAYGLGLIAAPARLAGRRWLGPGAHEAPAQVGLRGVGAREVALHGAALGLLLRGEDIRPWLAASMAGDLADVVATAAAAADLPAGSAPATAVVAGGSALLSLALAVLLYD